MKDNTNKLKVKDEERIIKKELKLYFLQKNRYGTIYTIEEVSEGEKQQNENDQQQQPQEIIMLQQQQKEDRLFDDLLSARRMADDQIQDVVKMFKMLTLLDKEY